MKIDLGKNELIHFVGIGGIGMSGLALIMNGLGYKVQGSDITYNRNIERLKEKKIRVFLNHKKENIKNTTVLVISSAIKKNNPELVEAKKKKFTNLYKRRYVGSYSIFHEECCRNWFTWKNNNNIISI